MEKKNKIKFIKSDSTDQEQLVASLINNENDVNMINVIDPNVIITNLEFLVDKSFRRGSFGDFHECYTEYIIRNSPLSVLLIFSFNNNLLAKFLQQNKIFVYKGEFAQYFSTFEAKDSNSVTRYTFKDFHLGHLMVGFERNEIKDFLATEDTCGEFEVQHKSSQYMSANKEKYEQGYFEAISNCSLKEMKELDKKIYNKSEYIEEKSKIKKKKK